MIRAERRTRTLTTFRPTNLKSVVCMREWGCDSQGLTRTSVIKRVVSAVDEIALRIVAESTEREAQLFRIS